MKKSKYSQFQSEGDLNLSSHRMAWQTRELSAETRALLEEDARYFLHQSLSTPCLNALEHCEGIYIQDLQGRRVMDFHGNGVHQVGFANEMVIEAIKSQLDELSFCTRRYSNRVAVTLARKLAHLAPGDLNKVLLCPGGTGAIGNIITLAPALTITLAEMGRALDILAECLAEVSQSSHDASAGPRHSR